MNTYQTDQIVLFSTTIGMIAIAGMIYMLIRSQRFKLYHVTLSYRALLMRSTDVKRYLYCTVSAMNKVQARRKAVRQLREREGVKLLNDTINIESCEKAK